MPKSLPYYFFLILDSFSCTVLKKQLQSPQRRFAFAYRGFPVHSIFSINNMKKTLFLLCALCAATTASATEYWVQGVNKSGGWFDTNKTGNNDSGFCWAATDTNILSWWYQQNKAASQAADEKNIPHTQEEIWDLYNHSFENGDSHPISGMKWYLNGDKPQAPAIKDSTKGGYAEALGVTIDDIVSRSIYDYDPAWEFNPELNNYQKTGTTPEDLDTYKLVTAELTKYIKDGYAIALGMSGKGYKHAITLWGIEVDDETQHMTRMWVTDSDDDLYTLADGTTPKYDNSGLIELTCKEDWVAYIGEEENKLYCYLVDSAQAGPNGDLFYRSKYNDQFYEFTAIKLALNISAPEPATATLSLLALAGLAARRRRK